VADREREPERRVRALALRGLPPLVLAVCFAGLAARTWRRWSDPVIDFGAELYIPWRLALGDRLYGDIAYRNGPLSPYLNALWFRLFGVSAETLMLCNLALLALLCGLAWRVFGAAGRLGQTAAVLALLVGFAFAQYAGIANYNYVTPYQHGQTHGVLLGFAAIAALGVALRGGRAAAWAAAGLSIGLAFLTKAELFVPALAAGGVAAALGFGMPEARPRRGLPALAAAALGPPLAAFALLAPGLGAGAAAAGVLGNWRYLGGGLLSDSFYRAGSGLDDPAGNVLAVAWSAAAVALALGSALALDRALLRVPARRALALGLGGVLFAGLAAAGRGLPWFETARALPATSAAGGAVLAVLWWRGDGARRAALAPLLVFSVYALALLGKMLLAPRFAQYGFVLAMPATLALVVAAVAGVPAVARRAFGGGALAQAVGVALVAAGLLALWRHSETLYARKDFRLGEAADAIVVERARGAVVAEALGLLEARMRPGETLLALPEGLFLNYWLRRRDPSRFWLFLPAEFAAVGGEAVMLEDVRAHPPDFVALVDRPHREFGVGPFGNDPRNGRALLGFVREGYDEVGRVGAEPFRNRGFGIALLRRKGAAPAAAVSGREPGGPGAQPFRAQR
jgi:Dolichyl-phosphate-mannose-protein mannosyltransferase